MRFHQPQGLLSGFMVMEAQKVTPELVHGGEQWAPRSYEIGTHYHDFWEIYFQAHGETFWSTQDATYHVGKSSFLAVPPRVVHWLDMPQTPTNHHFFFAGLNIKIVLERLPELKTCWSGDRVLYAQNAATVEPPFRQLIREITLDMPMRAAAIRCAIDSVLIEATRLLEQPAERHAELPPAFMHSAVLRARDLIDGNPAEKWNVADLAAMGGLSTSHFAERFMADVGMSPHAYLSERRLAAAKDMLATTDQSITSIGMELGYSSSQHFAGSFRKSTGMTPSEYRSHERMSTRK